MFNRIRKYSGLLVSAARGQAREHHFVSAMASLAMIPSTVLTTPFLAVYPESFHQYMEWFYGNLAKKGLSWRDPQLVYDGWEYMSEHPEVMKDYFHRMEKCFAFFEEGARQIKDHLPVTAVRR